MDLKFWKELLTLPNLFTLSRLILSFIIPVLWVINVSERLLYGLIIFGALSDTLDGNLARILNQKSKLGKILDPLADKCFINMLFFLFYLQGKIPLSFFCDYLFKRYRDFTWSSLPFEKGSGYKDS